MEKPVKANDLGGGGDRRWEWALLLVLLALILAILFHRSFIPNQIIYANDGPLGANNADSLKMPSAFVSVWRDLNFLGIYSGSFLLPVTGVLLWILKPFGFAKLYLPLVFLLLGCSAGLFFRRLKLAPAACLLGAIAMALNSEFFSTACWGIAIPATALAACFLALSAIVGDFQKISWARLALAGLAVGVCVMEAADVGAIFSVFVAAYLAYGTMTPPGAPGKKLGIAAARVACVAAFALFMAAQTVTGMVETQILGIKAAGQDEATKRAGWEEKTMWSLPKSEMISLAVPGLFGYGIVPRDDHPEDFYWGRVGQPQSWEDYFAADETGPTPAVGTIRHTGTGFYAGIMVVLLGFWAVAQSFRKRGSVFAPDQQRAVWFWLGAFVVSLLLAFGRHAPFYRLFYSLPYASTIRNPIKFMHTANWALVVMFAYGVHGLVIRYLNPPATTGKAAAPKLNWWRRLDPFDRKWILACAAVLLLAVVAVGIYAGSSTELAAHLEKVGFPNPDLARAIASQSVGAAVIFIPRLAFAFGAIVLVMAGLLAGSRARLGVIILGTVLTIDLATADVPWIRYQNFDLKYASNPVIDKLREKSFEHRVALVPSLQFTQPVPGLSQIQRLLGELYVVEWHQILFQYFNIQSLETVQLSRVPEDIVAFQHAMTNGPNPSILLRYWQLVNARYLLGPSIYFEPFNRSFPGFSNSFRVFMTFDVTNKPGVRDVRLYEDFTAVPDPNGHYALYEFTAALPRAKLYSQWEINPNDSAVLQKLGSEAFDPFKTVLVSSNVPPPSATNTAADAGTVEFTSYDTKRVVFKAEVKTPAILLFNDKYDPNWRVTVDGKPAELLRCNYIMRGVYLTPDAHVVEFRFVVSNRPLYVTLGAAAFGIILLGLVVAGKAGRWSGPIAWRSL